MFPPSERGICLACGNYWTWPDL